MSKQSRRHAGVPEVCTQSSQHRPKTFKVTMSLSEALQNSPDVKHGIFLLFDPSGRIFESGCEKSHNPEGPQTQLPHVLRSFD